MELRARLALRVDDVDGEDGVGPRARVVRLGLPEDAPRGADPEQPERVLLLVRAVLREPLEGQGPVVALEDRRLRPLADVVGLVALVEEVVERVVVDLGEGAGHGHVAALLPPLRRLAEDLADGPRHEAPAPEVVAADDRVRLAAARLPVGEDAAVAALARRRDDGLEERVDVLLRRLGAADGVHGEGEAPLRRLLVVVVGVRHAELRGALLDHGGGLALADGLDAGHAEDAPFGIVFGGHRERAALGPK